MRCFLPAALATAVLAPSLPASANLITNPTFQDVDGDGTFGDGWASFDDATFDNFFGGNGHASFRANAEGNSGGIFQPGIAAGPGDYRFSLTDNFFEPNFDANFSLGLEYYEADDATFLGSDITTVTTLAASIDSFGTAPAGTEIVRPIFRFSDPVVSGSNDNAFFFNSELVVVPEPASAALLAAGGLLLLRRRRR